MKQEIVPTSPKVLSKMPPPRISGLTVVLLSLFFGSLAGAAAYFVLNSGELVNRAETLVIREKTGDNQEIRLETLVDNVKPEILEVDSSFGVSLTADGWIVSELSGKVIKKNKEIYEIKQTAFDKTTGLSYYKINASNLKAAEFIDPEDKKLGLQVIAIKPGLEIKLLYLAGREKLNDGSPCSLLFNWEGELVGFNKLDGSVVWAEDISAFLSQLLTTNE